MINAAIRAAESGWVPDIALRLGIREVCRRRLRSLAAGPAAAAEATEAFVDEMSRGPIAVVPDKANEQHYEVPARLFELMLGPRRKYSCCYFPGDDTSLEAAERHSLEAACAHAELADGQRILELGCGWGSLTLFMAERYPSASITAVSNSASQRAYILEQAERMGLSNVEVITADINELTSERRFERVVSVEMFEHVRNHALLLERIAAWLAPGGKLFVHIFCSATEPYLFEDEDSDDWMARNFFSGGVMPSDGLLLRYQQHLQLERQWRWSGMHYKRTADEWLRTLDANRVEATEVLRAAGAPDPAVAVQRWRMFFMACSELFGYDGGRRWWVSHYRFRSA